MDFVCYIYIYCLIYLIIQNIFPSVLLSAFNSMIWNDGLACTTNIMACTLLIKQVVIRCFIVSLYVVLEYLPRCFIVGLFVVL